MKDFVRIAKPGAKIAVLFFTSKKLLAGYPLLEAALDNVETAHRPFTDKTKPDLHILRAPAWFKKCGLAKGGVKSYAVDLYKLDSDIISFLPDLCNMFWAQSKTAVSKELWQHYTDIVDPKSDNFIFAKDDYAGLFTYTLYSATVEK